MHVLQIVVQEMVSITDQYVRTAAAFPLVMIFIYHDYRNQYKEGKSHS